MWCSGRTDVGGRHRDAHPGRAAVTGALVGMLVALAGGAGAAVRFAVDGRLRGRRTPGSPVPTLVVNVSGSALMGLLTGALLFHSLPPTLYLVAGVGFCGGYTTFSTAMVETVRLAHGGSRRSAAGHAVGSVLLTLAAAALGVAVMRVLG